MPMSEPGIAALQAGARVAQQRETDFMTRYVIGPDVAVPLAGENAVIRGEHQLLAPALLRSQMLSLLYQAVRRGEMTRKEAERSSSGARAADAAARRPRPPECRLEGRRPARLGRSWQI
jgi:hypothetical protein